MDKLLDLLDSFYNRAIESGLLRGVDLSALDLFKQCLIRHESFLSLKIPWASLSVAELLPAGIFVSSTTLFHFQAAGGVIEKTEANEACLRILDNGLPTSKLKVAAAASNSIKEQGLDMVSTIQALLDQYNMPWFDLVSEELNASQDFQDFATIAPLVEFLLYTDENEQLYTYLFASSVHKPSRLLNMRPSWFLHTAILAYELYGLDRTAWLVLENKPMYLTTWAMLFFQRLVPSTNMMIPFSVLKIPCALLHLPYIQNDETFQVIYQCINNSTGLGLQTSGQPLHNWEYVTAGLKRCRSLIFGLTSSPERQSGLTVSLRGNELLTYHLVHTFFFQDARLGFHAAFILDDILLALICEQTQQPYYLWVPMDINSEKHSSLQHSNMSQATLKIAYHAGTPYQSAILDQYIISSKITMIDGPRETGIGLVLCAASESITTPILELLATKNQGYVLSEVNLNVRAAERFTSANGTNLCCEIIASTENGAGNLCFLSNINIITVCPLDPSVEMNKAFFEHITPAMRTASMIMTIAMRNPTFNLPCEIARHFNRCYTHPAHGAMIIGRSTALGALIASGRHDPGKTLGVLTAYCYYLLNAPSPECHAFEKQYYYSWLNLLRSYNPDLYEIIFKYTLGRFYPCEYRTTQAPGSRNLFLARHNNEWPGLARSLAPMQLNFLPSRCVVSISSPLCAWANLTRPKSSTVQDILNKLIDQQPITGAPDAICDLINTKPSIDSYIADYSALGEYVHQSISSYCLFPPGINEKEFIRHHLHAMRQKKMITLFYYASNTQHQPARIAAS